MKIMRLVVPGLGELELVATQQETEGSGTYAGFALVYNKDEELGRYVRPYFAEPDSIMSLMVEQGMEEVGWTDIEGWHILLFSRLVAGDLRDPEQYLRATAIKLRKELLAIERSERELDQLCQVEEPEFDGIGVPAWEPLRKHDRNLEHDDVIID